MTRVRAAAVRLACGLIACGLMVGCRSPRSADNGASASKPGMTTLVATAELFGTTEPCGCTSDPLGDLARVAGLARGGLWLDAGSLLYDREPPASTRRTQADLKAQAIVDIYSAAGAEVALGASDAHGGLEHARPPRDACNVTGGPPTVAPHVREVSGLRVGIFGLTSPKAWAKSSVAVADPIAAGKAAVATIAGQKPDVVVALLAMPRAEARAVLSAVPGIDVGIIGADVEEGMPEAEPVGGGWLVAPADQGRRVASIQLVRGPAGPRAQWKLFDGESGRRRTLERTDKRMAALKAQLAAFAADKSADPAFVAARQHELDELGAERQRLASAPLKAPDPPYFSYALQPVKRGLARDPKVAERLRALDRAIGAANFAAAKGEAPPPATEGKPSYVGDSACARCHKQAVSFWKTTRHAQAWKTLVDVDKQYNYDCTGCHVTGWQEPGGANLGTVEGRHLTNVQCEVCHGPGSRHVEEDGLDEPKTIRRNPADDLCRSRCHTAEHSDTFALEPYLRDIVGGGHGEARRNALGNGPTGHELRSKATAAAK